MRLFFRKDQISNTDSYHPFRLWRETPDDTLMATKNTKKERDPMPKVNAIVLAATLIAAGCTAQTSESAGAKIEPGNVSEAVAALAAPGQDLASARLLPVDGCYWYEHRSPVETTLLPLRTAGGNPICAARDS